MGVNRCIIHPNTLKFGCFFVKIKKNANTPIIRCILVGVGVLSKNEYESIKEIIFK